MWRRHRFDLSTARRDEQIMHTIVGRQQVERRRKTNGKKEKQPKTREKARDYATNFPFLSSWCVARVPRPFSDTRASARTQSHRACYARSDIHVIMNGTHTRVSATNDNSRMTMGPSSSRARITVFLSADSRSIVSVKKSRTYGILYNKRFVKAQ